MIRKNKEQEDNQYSTCIHRMIEGNSNISSEDEATSSEVAPIMLSESEDVLEIDASDVEIEKIASKYSKRHNHQRTKKLIFYASTVAILLAFTAFNFHRSNSGASSPSSMNVSTKDIPKHEAFTHVKSKFLTGYQASIHLYKHTKTQAEFIAFSPIDSSQDKTFGVSFRTKPTSNNGVAHILEHSVLSGSKNYPAKDPFLHLLKGSLHTFLNAMTYNDRTVYPIASRNSKDFKNLMSVYLDAVFYPNCVEESGKWILKQEGWRYDFIDDSDDIEGTDNGTKQEMEVKGVVYSEMKGVFSNPESVIYRNTDKFLFPDNTYFFDSGGEPSNIPSLTHDEFVDFYHRHYHPTNAQLFVSGTLHDIEASMEMIDSGYLSNYVVDQKIKDNSQIDFQKKTFSHHLYQSLPYSVTEETSDEGQHLFLITWLLNDKEMDQKLELALYVLDYLLVGSTSSPLNKVLMDSGLGSNVIGDGINPGLLQTTFAIGMKGVKDTDIQKLESVILGIFRDLTRNGFNDDDIQAAMNSIEFQLREVQKGSDPMGISVFLNILTKWNYDQDPFSALEYEDALNSLKTEIDSSGSRYFVNLIKEFFLENNHRVHMELRPSATLGEETILEEKNKMKKLSDSLSSNEYDSIKTEAEMLKTIQNTDDPPEVVAMIPSLSIEDIDQSGVEFPIQIEEQAFGTGATLVTHNVHGSPGIVYIDVGVDIASVPFSEIELLPFVSTLLTECNTTSYSRIELDRLSGTYTGGINVDLELIPVYDEKDETIVTEGTKMQTYLFLRGKCTVENAAKMLGLIKEIVENNTLISQEKAIQLIERKISNLKSSIASRGHSYSVSRMSARYDVQSFMDEKIHGVSQLKALESMLVEANNDWNQFKERLSSILEKISKIRSSQAVINLTGDEAALHGVQGSIQEFLESLSHDDGGSRPDYSVVDHPWIAAAQEEMSEKSPLIDEGIVISSQVSYVGEGGVLYDSGESVSGSTCAPLQYLKKGYLWDEVRAKNGAYGVMAELVRTDGTLFMVSYRDPNLVNTLDIYNAAGDFLLKELEGELIKDEDIVRAIIGCIGALDGSAQPPRSAGWISFYRYMSNSSATRRQKWRDGILGTSKDDFIDFGQRLKTWQKTSVAVVASEKAILDVNKNSQLGLKLVEAY